MLCRPLRLPTMYDGDQKLKPRSSEKKWNEFLAEETKGRDPPRNNGFKVFLSARKRQLALLVIVFLVLVL